MFTGIIEETGTVLNIYRNHDKSGITIGAQTVLADVRKGDSICVSGICLTVTSFNSSSFTADVMPETWNRSALGRLRVGELVNLERAMPADGRFGGHIVSGHIDGTGKIIALRNDGNAVWYHIRTSAEILCGIVEKGSIAIDGISLTVARVLAEEFSVSIIPHTLQHTALHRKRTGDEVSLENDCIFKYVKKLIGNAAAGSGITRDFLTRNGY
ncbi:MAG: riboflavin synthase [Lachnospiraceae bacterium]